MRDVDYTNDLALRTNTLSKLNPCSIALSKSQKNIGLYENTDEIVFKCFEEEGANFILTIKDSERCRPLHILR